MPRVRVASVLIVVKDHLSDCGWRKPAKSVEDDTPQTPETETRRPDASLANFDVIVLHLSSVKRSPSARLETKLWQGCRSSKQSQYRKQPVRVPSFGMASTTRDLQLSLIAVLPRSTGPLSPRRIPNSRADRELNSPRLPVP